MAAVSRRCSHHLSALPKILLLITPLWSHVEREGGVLHLYLVELRSVPGKLHRKRSGVQRCIRLGAWISAARMGGGDVLWSQFEHRTLLRS